MNISKIAFKPLWFISFPPLPPYTGAFGILMLGVLPNNIKISMNGYLL